MILVGDVTERLAEISSDSVQCVVTSPPYWGLRDYGTAKWEGGDAGCDHSPEKRGGRFATPVSKKQASNTGSGTASTRDCSCGARRIDAQIGLEPTPEAYVEKLVAVFREVRRVLRQDGTLWLNLGDCYATGAGSYRNPGSDVKPIMHGGKQAFTKDYARAQPNRMPLPGLKPKDLVGIPWRVAFALQQPYYTGKIRDERDRVWLAAMIEAEGCMFIHRRKEGQNNGQGYERKNDSFGAGLEVSSTDRVIVERCMEIAKIGSICEQSPEQNARRKQTIYRWNARLNACRDVVRELYPHMIAKQHEARLLLGCPSSGPKATEAWQSLKALHQGGAATIDFPAPAPMFEPGWYLRAEIIWAKKNCMPESVMDRPTKSHEQVFLLSKSPRYFFDQEAVREAYAPASLERNEYAWNGHLGRHVPGEERGPRTLNAGSSTLFSKSGRNIRTVWTIATQPFPEAHFATFPEELAARCIKAGSRQADTVLDPFLGSGTTAVAALQLLRNFIGIELNPTYAKMAQDRLNATAPLLLAIQSP